MAYFREITEHYRIEKTLSSREGGTVHRALDPVTGAAVILKLIALGDAPPESAQAFVRAMGILQATRHPSLPALFDFGFTPDGYAFLVLEYVEGRDALALAGGSPAQILPLLSQVIDGLERLAEEGLGHHNLCPENLLVVPDAAPGRIQVTGLGTAPLRPPGGRPEREAAAYAAPELGRPGEWEAAPWRADLYSLARIACHLLEARTEGNGESPRIVLPLGVSFELENDRVLVEVLEQALRARPEERPGGAEMRQAFARALAGESGRPRPLPESRLYLSAEPTEPNAEPWLPLAAPRPLPVAPPPPPPPPALDDTHPVFPPALPPPPEPLAAFPLGSLGADFGRREGTGGVPPPWEGEGWERGEGRRGVAATATDALRRSGAPLLASPLLQPPPAQGGGTRPEPAAPELPPEPLPSAGRSRRRAPLWGGVAAAVLAVAAGAGFLALRPRTPEPVAPPPRPAPRPPAPAPVALPAAAQPEPPAPALLPEKLVLARDAFAEGREAAAREVLATLTREEEAALPPEACNVYGVLRASLDAAQRSRRTVNFRASLAAGDLPQLAAAVRSLSPADRSALASEPGLRKDLAQARKAADLYQRYQRAVQAGEPAELLAAAGAVTASFPRFAEAAEQRERTAARLEGEAETLFQTGAVDGAVERLETLRRGWPERPGLAEKIARYTAEQRADQKMAGVLAAAAAAESRQRPDEGLAQLTGVKPTPRYEARFRDTRTRLLSQLAQLDGHPPVVQLGAPAAQLEFEKGATVRIPLQITDDYQVKTVLVRVRPEGEAWTELPCNRTGAECTIEVAPSLHQNKTIELWVTATDLSGHKGQLGSAEKPQSIRRKHWYDRLRGKG